MAPPEGYLEPSENTSLLSTKSSDGISTNDGGVLPTYDNGTLPLTSSYSDLKESVELQLQTMKEGPRGGRNKKLNFQERLRIVDGKGAILLLLLGVVLTISFVFLLNDHSVSDESSSSHVVKFSSLDPVKDLGIMEYTRPEATGPPPDLFESFEASENFSDDRHPLPTNSWYQNLMLTRGEPSNLQRVYTAPYLLDLVGTIPGLRIHRNHLLSNNEVLQLSFNENFGLTLGAAPHGGPTDEKLSHSYKVLEATELGLTLQWNAMKMVSTIARGMAYGTVEYHEKNAKSDMDNLLFPTITSNGALGKPAVVDGHEEIICNGESPKKIRVENEVELYFANSDYTWLVFFSEPVWVQCFALDGPPRTYIQVTGYDNENDDTPLIVRSALLNSCTKGVNPVSCKEGLGDRLPEEKQVDEYATVLRKYARFVPGRHSAISYDIEDGKREAKLTFNWDVREITRDDSQGPESRLGKPSVEEIPDGLIMYALPHHLDKLDSSLLPGGLLYCRSSLTGPACLVRGNTWTMVETLPPIGFRAPRPPKADAVPLLAKALQEDIDYALPKFFENGAGDTYFSGKMLARLARVMVIYEEVLELCHPKTHDYDGYVEVCKNSTLPTPQQASAALERLRRSVEIWINGKAETVFVYDRAWGGVVSCGCRFNGTGCDNRAPDCPAFGDQGLNFGNGFYNDQHFHYGYHIYAAAVVAHFDEAWGRRHFENVLLLVRSIANPSKDDTAFPLYRHKDWYQGSSWASGIVLPPYLNGKNQESSSEAIAAYEAVALYGKEMSKIWKKHGDSNKVIVSKEIQKVGGLMTATEIRSAQRYWHVYQNDESKQVYPSAYGTNVIGILWSTMAQFGTWFGRAPYLPYGIQLLPLTPISEERDDLAWVNEMYYPFAQACSESFQCTESGWSILELAILATVGYVDEAVERVASLPDDSYVNAGGNGHSKSNTLWYLSTRPEVTDPIPMHVTDLPESWDHAPAPVFQLKDCHVPKTCTDDILDRMIGGFSCRDRIKWLIDAQGKSQWEACATVAGLEFPNICGPCDPGQGQPIHGQGNTIEEEDWEDEDLLECPPCSLEECSGDLNRCPILKRTFVCTGGASRGGCSGKPWADDESQCNACCEMTSCQELKDKEALKVTNDGNAFDRPECPPCTPEYCYGNLNRCPLHDAPYLCLEGGSTGGCSSMPWVTTAGAPCSKCCEITPSC